MLNAGMPGRAEQQLRTVPLVATRGAGRAKRKQLDSRKAAHGCIPLRRVPTVLYRASPSYLLLYYSTVLKSYLVIARVSEKGVGGSPPAKI